MTDEPVLFPRLRQRIQNLLNGNQVQRRPEEYQYKTLPDACICTECGYVLENPGGHCRYIECPRCGDPMWRKRA